MNNEVQTTWGFWVGLIAGMILGCFVGGIALIGQGVWEGGRYWGYQQCKAEGRE